MTSRQHGRSVSSIRLAHMQQQVDALRDDIEHTVSADVRAVLQESLSVRVALLRARGSTIARWT